MTDESLTRDELNALDQAHACGVTVGDAPPVCTACNTVWPCDTHQWVGERLLALNNADPRPHPLDGEDG